MYYFTFSSKLKAVQYIKKYKLTYIPRKISLPHIYYPVVSFPHVGEIGDFLNASSGWPFIISINGIWYAHLFYDIEHEDITLNAFKITMGHEYAHKIFDSLYYSIIKSYVSHDTNAHQLTCNIAEVHHDFYGCQIFGNCNQINLISACMYKKKFKNLCGAVDDEVHPTWNERMKYAKYGSFDRNLLYMIAESAKTNYTPTVEKLINDIYNFYGEIHLK